MYTHTRTRTHTHTHTHRHTHTHTQTAVFVYACMRECMNACVYVYVDKCICVYVYVYTYIYIHLCLYSCVCAICVFLRHIQHAALLHRCAESHFLLCLTACDFFGRVAGSRERSQRSRGHKPALPQWQAGSGLRVMLRGSGCAYSDSPSAMHSKMCEAKVSRN